MKRFFSKLQQPQIGKIELANCYSSNYLRRLFLYDKGTFDKLIQQHVEAIGELREDVHAGLLVGDVESLMNHLQLSDLLPIDPDYFRQVLTPEGIQLWVVTLVSGWGIVSAD